MCVYIYIYTVPQFGNEIPVSFVIFWYDGLLKGKFSQKFHYFFRIINFCFPSLIDSIKMLCLSVLWHKPYYSKRTKPKKVQVRLLLDGVYAK